MSEHSSRPSGPKFIGAFNFIVEETSTLMDLAGGGGQEPPVIAYMDQDDGTKSGPNYPVRTNYGPYDDESAQWRLRGADVESLDSGEPVSVCSARHTNSVLDLEGGNPTGRILTYNYHGSPNQLFKLRRKW